MRATRLLLLLSLLILGGCSVYKSRGRTSFESKAPDSIKSGIVGQCWRQPGNEALWRTDAEQFTVQSHKEDNSIEVCAADVSKVDHSPSGDDLAGALGR